MICTLLQKYLLKPPLSDTIGFGIITYWRIHFMQDLYVLHRFIKISCYFIRCLYGSYIGCCSFHQLSLSICLKDFLAFSFQFSIHYLFQKCLFTYSLNVTKTNELFFYIVNALMFRLHSVPLWYFLFSNLKASISTDFTFLFTWFLIFHVSDPFIHVLLANW